MKSWGQCFKNARIFWEQEGLFKKRCASHLEGCSGWEAAAVSAQKTCQSFLAGGWWFACAVSAGSLFFLMWQRLLDSQQNASWFVWKCLKVAALWGLGLQPWDHSRLGGFQYSDLMSMTRMGLSFKIRLAGLNAVIGEARSGSDYLLDEPHYWCEQ